MLVAALVGGAVGVGGARARTPQLFPTAVASAPASASTTTATHAATQAAIKDVIQKANAAQAAAFAKNDPTLMQATSTAAHYAEMVKINSELSAGVYMVICNEPGHFAAGMHVQLTVLPLPGGDE